MKPLYLFISETTGYINIFDKNKITMSLMIKDIQLLKSYNKVWEKTEKLMKIDFNTKTTYGDGDNKYIKTKKDNITTNFYNKKGFKKAPKEKVSHKCLLMIILDSIIYVYENIKTKNYIDEGLKSESESDIDTDTDSDNDIDIDVDSEE